MTLIYFAARREMDLKKHHQNKTFYKKVHLD